MSHAGLTISEFLSKTEIPFTEIAAVCGVDVSQVYRWKHEECVPGGVELARLYELSGKTIDITTVKYSKEALAKQEQQKQARARRRRKVKRAS